jgi:hypothetical protein
LFDVKNLVCQPLGEGCLAALPRADQSHRREILEPRANDRFNPTTEHLCILEVNFYFAKTIAFSAIVRQTAFKESIFCWKMSFYDSITEIGRGSRKSPLSGLAPAFSRGLRPLGCTALPTPRRL